MNSLILTMWTPHILIFFFHFFLIPQNDSEYNIYVKTCNDPSSVATSYWQGDLQIENQVTLKHIKMLYWSENTEKKIPNTHWLLIDWLYLQAFYLNW